MKKRTKQIGLLLAASLLALSLAFCTKEKERISGYDCDADTCGFHKDRISIPDEFDKLERSASRFDHDKHTEALKQEDCTSCHKETEDKQLNFSFALEKPGSGSEALMEAYHQKCIGCHEKRASEKVETGPTTCDECHAGKPDVQKFVYAPVLPETYNAVNDPYHMDCMSCHDDIGGHEEKKGAPNWKHFHNKKYGKPHHELAIPKFTHSLHSKHSQVLKEETKEDCKLCHTLSDKKVLMLEEEGADTTADGTIVASTLSRKDKLHAKCVNCHLVRSEKEPEAGPIGCKDCHTYKDKPEYKDSIVYPDIEQESKILIEAEGKLRAKPVPFDHEFHFDVTQSCNDCHHKSMQSCDECHTLDALKNEKTMKKSGGITLAEAYHQADSKRSCIGCHEEQKQKPDCSGCHQYQKSGLNENACETCHAGTLDELDVTRKLPSPADLFPEDLKDSMVIDLMENEYHGAAFPHGRIVKALTDVSNKNKLASYFHRDKMTMCMGCHHLGPMEEQKMVAECVTCHVARNEPTTATPTLLGAYHQQCLGCHKEMGGKEEEMPKDCTGCHQAKEE